ncbi:MAG: hypothetical protein DI551_07895 [Micavibrio aeruginosavorus]|uniref:Tetrapyrrole biosynthesis uroporphyrinogen III synthase domain-containing protein n=1 Tax=Micavibrio aeruginosavorus TaxID=349221 RepID=A0A2W5MYN0_9BACT|nr:MAG: hypothetical protein DI551_07895 [Micavibrio aeruginosavorus]
MMDRYIAIVRSGEDAPEIEAAIREAGRIPLFEPILKIEPIDVDLPEIEQGEALVFTSGHAIEVFAERSGRRNIPVYTVGRNTADIARQNGFTNIVNAAGTVDDLAEILKIVAKSGEIDLIYLRGEDVSQDLRGILNKNGVNLREFTLYRAILADSLSLALLKAIDQRALEAVMLFSARGALALAELLEQYDRAGRMRTTKALCIGDSVVQSVSVLPFERVLVSSKPDRHGMIELITQLPPLDLRK